MADSSTAVLATHALQKRFGGIVATHDVSIRLAHGARHALIGPNGAGKTTLVNLLTGMLTPSSGRIELDGADITSLATHERARRGLVRTFQITQLFDTLTALETIVLVIAQRERIGAHCLRSLLSRADQVGEAERLLSSLHLGAALSERVATLPYGKRRLLEIAIALAARPRVLLLDEPLAGVPAAESREILETLSALPSDVSVLLIEHDMDVVFRFATRISVLVSGALLVEGPPDAIATDPRVRAVYLGESRNG